MEEDGRGWRGIEAIEEIEEIEGIEEIEEIDRDRDRKKNIYQLKIK